MEWNEVSKTSHTFINYFDWDQDEVWHPWMFQRSSWFLQVNRGVSKPRRSFLWLTWVILAFDAAPFHHSMKPRAVTMGLTLGRFMISHFTNLHRALRKTLELQNRYFSDQVPCAPLNRTTHKNICTYLSFPEMTFFVVQIWCHTSCWIEWLLLISGFGSSNI